MYNFQKLIVWQEARLLVKNIYHLVADYPTTEKFSLVDQMKRASISIVSNIAEGSGRKSQNDQAHFYTMAFSSAMELLNQLIISSDLGYITPCEMREAEHRIQKIAMMISGLRKSCYQKK